jgi:hypothetical protein
MLELSCHFIPFYYKHSVEGRWNECHLNVKDADEDEREKVVENHGMQHETPVVPILKTQL